jgi:hypothetical protein
MALAAGVVRAHVDALAGGDLDGSPPSEIPALLYAQHWAETDARPDPEVRRRLLETYGQAKTEAIELSMRMIRVGNLMGDTWDYLMHRVSLGHWGNARRCWASCCHEGPLPRRREQSRDLRGNFLFHDGDGMRANAQPDAHFGRPCVNNCRSNVDGICI